MATSIDSQVLCTSAAAAIATALMFVASPALAQAAPGQAGSQTGTRTEAESEPASDTPGDAGITQAQADAPPGSGDIIVTAQKRAERLQDVPLAVTAVGGDALAARQINDVNSLAAAVPSLTFSQGANPNNSNLRIRGVGTALFGQGVEPSVAVVVDGVVAARSAQGFADIADVERVEVLRGPQGTLFGRNATAGLINVVTARPSSKFGGRVDVTVAEADEYRIKGTVTGPISDTVLARVTGFYNDVGGYIKNLTTGRDVNGSRSWGLRGKVEWDATDDLTVLFSGEYRDQEALCCANVPISYSNPTKLALIAPIVPSRSNRQIEEDTETEFTATQFTGSVQADWDLGPATITSITAYQKYDTANNQPIDRSDSDPILFLGAPNVAPYSAWPLNGGEVNIDNFSQEVRLASNGGPLTYVFGVFYNHLELDRPFERRRASCVQRPAGQPQLSPLDVCPDEQVRYQSSSSLGSLTTDSYALFGQAEPRIIGGLSAIVGMRVQYEKGVNTLTQYGPLVQGDAIQPGTPYVAGGTNTGTIEGDDWALTGKAGFKYEFNRDAQGYVTWTRGYKGQGYDMEAGTDPLNQKILEPEDVDAYEIGFKFSTIDRLLSLNIAAFLADYTNLQVQANRGDPLTGVTRFESVNAGDARTKGVEIEGVLRPSADFTVTGGVTYAKTAFNIDGLNCPIQLQPDAPVVSATDVPYNTCVRTTAGGATFQNIQGAPFPNSPRWRYTVSPRYDTDVTNDLAAFAQFSVSYSSSFNFAIEQDPLQVQDAYTLVDASIGLRDAEDRWNVTLFVKNLFDQTYYTSTAHTALLSSAARSDMEATFNKDADRYFGVTVGSRF